MRSYERRKEKNANYDNRDEVWEASKCGAIGRRIIFFPLALSVYFCQDGSELVEVEPDL